jgi:hypothetical protein
MMWQRLKRLLGSGSSEDRDDGIYIFVRCNSCGDRVRVRLNPAADLRQDFGEQGLSGYSVRKVVVDQHCFRPIEVTMRFDSSRREQSREIEGGTFISREEYELPTTPPHSNGG